MNLPLKNLLPSTFACVALATLAACGTAPQQETATTQATATGTRGGGEVITTANGQQQLRDLTEKTNCSWEMGKNVAESLPTFENIADSASKQHWSYGPLLKQGAAQLSVCFTEGNLIRVDTTDLGDSLAIVEQNGKQAAIRYNNKIYVDNKIWTQLNQQQKSYLFTHEVLHSFLSMQEKQRNQKLRSAVNLLIKNSQSEIDHDTFKFNLTENKIAFGTDFQLKFKDRFAKDFQDLYQGQGKYTKLRALHQLNQLADKWSRESNRDAGVFFSEMDQRIIMDVIDEAMVDVRENVLLSDSDGLLTLFKNGMPIQIAQYVGDLSTSLPFLKAARAADFLAEEYHEGGELFFRAYTGMCIVNSEDFSRFSACMTTKNQGNLSRLLLIDRLKNYGSGPTGEWVDSLENILGIISDKDYNQRDWLAERFDWVLAHALSSHLDFEYVSRANLIKNFPKDSVRLTAIDWDIGWGTVSVMPIIRKWLPRTYKFLNQRR